MILYSLNLSAPHSRTHLTSSKLTPATLPYHPANKTSQRLDYSYPHDPHISVVYDDPSPTPTRLQSERGALQFHPLRARSADHSRPADATLHGASPGRSCGGAGSRALSTGGRPTSLLAVSERWRDADRTDKSRATGRGRRRTLPTALIICPPTAGGGFNEQHDRQGSAPLPTRAEENNKRRGVSGGGGRDGGL